MKVAKYISKPVSAVVLTTALSSLAVIAAGQAQQDSQEQALRELKIMRNIFDAALEADEQQNRMRMAPPEVMYLAGQGMVFTFQMNGMPGFYFGGQLQQQTEQLRAQSEQMRSQSEQVRAQAEQVRAQAEQVRAQAEQVREQVAQAIPPIPPVVYVDGDFDFDFDFDYDFDFDGGFVSEGDAAYRDQLRAMNETMRDKQEEMRALQREIRNLEREERGDPDTDNQAGIDRISAEMEALAEEIQSQSESMQQLQQEYQSARTAVLDELRTRQTNLIFDTLCTYGNTLRSLDNGQHVNIVLRNYADNEAQVYVLDYADIASCTSATSLRQAAVSYAQPNNQF